MTSSDSARHLHAIQHSDDNDGDEGIRLTSRATNRSQDTIRLIRPSRADPDAFSAHKSPRDDRIRLFDGENTPQNISTYGFLLGLVCGGGLLFAVLCDPSRQPPQFGIFLAALALFHFLEYLATALFNPDKLTLDCKLSDRTMVTQLAYIFPAAYLINHSAHYHAAHAAAFVEFIVEYYLFPSWKTFGWINYIGTNRRSKGAKSSFLSNLEIGLFLVILGQTCRTTAMFSARHNFSHHIADAKEPDHVLVTHGIYRYAEERARKVFGREAYLSIPVLCAIHPTSGFIGGLLVFKYY